MAHAITNSDGLALALKPGWHGLGTVVDHAMTVDEALQVAGLGWEIEQLPLSATKELAAGQYERVPVETHVANMRKDNGQILAVVTNGYEVVQNHNLARFILKVAEKSEDQVRVETAGSVQEGRKVWFLAQSPTLIEVGKGDVVVPYVLFSNAHDGTAALRITPTSIRVVCKNTFDASVAVHDKKEQIGQAITIRHSGDMDAKLDAARKAIHAAMRGHAIYETAIKQMAAVKFGSDLAVATGQASAEGQVMCFFRAVYEAAIGKVPTEIKTEADERARDKATEIVAQWFANFNGERQTSFGIGGTVWAALNSVTEWSDHTKPIRGQDKMRRAELAEKKVHRNLWGTGATLKAAAWQVAEQALVAAG